MIRPHPASLGGGWQGLTTGVAERTAGWRRAVASYDLWAPAQL